MTITELPLSTLPLMTLSSFRMSSKMQAGGGFVQDVDGPPGRALLQFRGQFHPLRLAAGQCRRRLSQPDVTQPDVDEVCR